MEHKWLVSTMLRKIDREYEEQCQLGIPHGLPEPITDSRFVGESQILHE